MGHPHKCSAPERVRSACLASPYIEHAQGAHLVVELVVQVAVDLLGVAVLAQQAAQHAQPPHPQHLGRQPRLARAPPLACGAALLIRSPAPHCH